MNTVFPSMQGQQASTPNECCGSRGSIEMPTSPPVTDHVSSGAPKVSSIRQAHQTCAVEIAPPGKLLSAMLRQFVGQCIFCDQA